MTCRHRLWLQLPLPLSLILFSSLQSQWICNEHAGFWIWDGGMQVSKTAERSGSDRNAGCGARYNVMSWVCLWGCSGCWCDTTACTQNGGWSIHWLSLCSGQGGRHTLSDICNRWIVQWRWGGGVLTLDCRHYRIPSLRGIPLASRYGNVSLSRQKLKIPRRRSLWLIQTNSKISNVFYDRCRVRVRALGRHSLIWMFNVKNIGNISCAYICNGRWGKLLFDRPGRDSTNKEGAV